MGPDYSGEFDPILNYSLTGPGSGGIPQPIACTRRRVGAPACRFRLPSCPATPIMAEPRAGGDKQRRNGNRSTDHRVRRCRVVLPQFHYRNRRIFRQLSEPVSAVLSDRYIGRNVRFFANDRHHNGHRELRSRARIGRPRRTCPVRNFWISAPESDRLLILLLFLCFRAAFDHNNANVCDSRSDLTPSDYRSRLYHDLGPHFGSRFSLNAAIPSTASAEFRADR